MTARGGFVLMEDPETGRREGRSPGDQREAALASKVKTSKKSGRDSMGTCLLKSYGTPRRQWTSATMAAICRLSPRLVARFLGRQARGEASPQRGWVVIGCGHGRRQRMGVQKGEMAGMLGRCDMGPSAPSSSLASRCHCPSPLTEDPLLMGIARSVQCQGNAGAAFMTAHTAGGDCPTHGFSWPESCPPTTFEASLNPEKGWAPSRGHSARGAAQRLAAFLAVHGLDLLGKG